MPIVPLNRINTSDTVSAHDIETQLRRGRDFINGAMSGSDITNNAFDTSDCAKGIPKLYNSWEGESGFSWGAFAGTSVWERTYATATMKNSAAVASQDLFFDIEGTFKEVEIPPNRNAWIIYRAHLWIVSERNIYQDENNNSNVDHNGADSKLYVFVNGDKKASTEGHSFEEEAAGSSLPELNLGMNGSSGATEDSMMRRQYNVHYAERVGSGTWRVGIKVDPCVDRLYVQEKSCVLEVIYV